MLAQTLQARCIALTAMVLLCRCIHKSVRAWPSGESTTSLLKIATSGMALVVLAAGCINCPVPSTSLQSVDESPEANNGIPAYRYAIANSTDINSNTQTFRRQLCPPHASTPGTDNDVAAAKSISAAAHLLLEPLCRLGDRSLALCTLINPSTCWLLAVLNSLALGHCLATFQVVKAQSQLKAARCVLNSAAVRGGRLL